MVLIAEAGKSAQVDLAYDTVGPEFFGAKAHQNLIQEFQLLLVSHRDRVGCGEDSHQSAVVKEPGLGGQRENPCTPI